MNKQELIRELKSELASTDKIPSWASKLEASAGATAFKIALELAEQLDDPPQKPCLSCGVFLTLREDKNAFCFGEIPMSEIYNFCPQCGRRL